MKSGSKNSYLSETGNGRKRVNAHLVKITGIVWEMDFITGTELKPVFWFATRKKSKMLQKFLLVLKVINDDALCPGMQRCSGQWRFNEPRNWEQIRFSANAWSLLIFTKQSRPWYFSFFSVVSESRYRLALFYQRYLFIRIFFCSFAAVSIISCPFRAGAPRAADPEIIHYLCNEFNLLCIPILTFDAGDTVSRIYFIPDHRRLF